MKVYVVTEYDFTGCRPVLVFDNQFAAKAEADRRAELFGPEYSYTVETFHLIESGKINWLLMFSVGLSSLVTVYLLKVLFQFMTGG